MGKRLCLITGDGRIEKSLMLFNYRNEGVKTFDDLNIDYEPGLTNVTLKAGKDMDLDVYLRIREKVLTEGELEVIEVLNRFYDYWAPENKYFIVLEDNCPYIWQN